MLVLEFSANSIKNLSQLIWLALPYTVYFLPFMLAYALWTTYLEYIRAKYIANEERIMLEIKIPKVMIRPMAKPMMIARRTSFFIIWVSRPYCNREVC